MAIDLTHVDHAPAATRRMVAAARCFWKRPMGSSTVHGDGLTPDHVGLGRGEEQVGAGGPTGSGLPARLAPVQLAVCGEPLPGTPTSELGGVAAWTARPAPSDERPMIAAASLAMVRRREGVSMQHSMEGRTVITTLHRGVFLRQKASG